MVLEDDLIGKHEPEDTSLNFLTRLMTNIEVMIMITDMMSMMNTTPMMIGTVLIGLWEGAVPFSLNKTEG